MNTSADIYHTIHNELLSISHPLFNEYQNDLTQLIMSYGYDYIPAYIDDGNGVNGAISTLLYSFAYLPDILQALKKYCDTHPSHKYDTLRNSSSDNTDGETEDDDGEDGNNNVNGDDIEYDEEVCDLLYEHYATYYLYDELSEMVSLRGSIESRTFKLVCICQPLFRAFLDNATFSRAIDQIKALAPYLNFSVVNHQCTHIRVDKYTARQRQWYCGGELNKYKCGIPDTNNHADADTDTYLGKGADRSIESGGSNSVDASNGRMSNSLMDSLSARSCEIACNQCISKYDMHKHALDVSKLPPIFIVDTGRVLSSEFHSSTYTMKQQHSTHRFTFPQILDLSNSISKKHKYACMYQLHAIICYHRVDHQYFTLIRPSVHDSQWIRYQCTTMSLWDGRMIEKDCYGGNDAEAFAVRLFYQKIKS